MQYWSLVIFRSLGQGHISISHLAKQITEEFFVSEASNLVQIILGDYLMPIDIQVNRSEFKIKGHVGLPYLVQRITQEGLSKKYVMVLPGLFTNF